MSMMNNECERVGLPEPRITDNGFMDKVIFKRPSADDYKKDTAEGKKDTIGSKKDTVTLKKDTVTLEKDTVKDTVEHQLNTGRTSDIDKKDTSSTEKEHQLKVKKTPAEGKKDTSSTEKEHQLKVKKTPARKRNRQELRIINIIGEDWYSATDLREALNYKSKSTFIKNYLTPMLEKGILKLEKDTSLTSPNQRYGLTVKGKAIYYSNK